MLPQFRQEVARLRAILDGETDVPSRAAAECQLGCLLARVGEANRALAHLDAAKRWIEWLHDPARLCEIDHMIGVAWARKGDHARARAFTERAYDAARRRGDAGAQARIAASLAMTYAAAGKFDS